MTQNPEAYDYDPSYGVTYQGVGPCNIAAPCDASQYFESAAVEGYVKAFAFDAPGVLRMRDSAGLSFIRFDR